MTKSDTAKLREIAKRLLAYEAASAASAEKSAPAAFLVCERLRGPLTALAGATGFQSLLQRALKLARRDAPGLSAVQVNPEELQGCGALEGDLDREAEVFLVAHLIELLIAFIGEPLTLRLMQDAWPDGAFNSERKMEEGKGPALPGRAGIQKPVGKTARVTAERTGKH